MNPTLLLVPKPPARRLQCLWWAAQGLTQRQVGRAMFITENSVKTHLKLLYRELGVAGLTQALSVAYEYDWWDEPPPPVIRFVREA